jgi:hypothetical protein
MQHTTMSREKDRLLSNIASLTFRTLLGIFMRSAGFENGCEKVLWQSIFENWGIRMGEADYVTQV